MATAAHSFTKRLSPRTRKSPEIVFTDSWTCCYGSYVSSGTDSMELPKTCQREVSKLACEAIDISFPVKKDHHFAHSPPLTDRHKFPETNKHAIEVVRTDGMTSLVKEGFASGSLVERPFRFSLSPGRVSPVLGALSSLSNMNGANTRPNSFKSRSSPTLYEIMFHERELRTRPLDFEAQVNSSSSDSKKMEIAGNRFNDPNSSDVKLKLSNKYGFIVTLYVHKHILASNSQFFAEKLLERSLSPSHLVEVSDCENVEDYVETIRFMYYRDMKQKLMKESVSRVLGILKVAVAIVFEAGVLSCLEYLEATPWAQEEEEKVIGTVLQLQLDSYGAGDVLKRLSIEEPSQSEDILLHLLHSVTRSTNDKSRQKMKDLVSRLLRESVAVHEKDRVDISKDRLQHCCNACLDSLLHLFRQVAKCDLLHNCTEDKGLLATQIARESDNLCWLVEILHDRQIMEDFVILWASQTELAALHIQIPAMFRYQVSRLTARICIAVGKGQALVPKDTRVKLLQIWLEPLIDDFAWMRRGCKGFDLKVLEEGLSQMILTLPLKHQENIIMSWFGRFLKNGHECPNLQVAFEGWWRRRFVRPCVERQSIFAADGS